MPPSPAEIADAGPFPPVEGVLDRALALVEYLREHCPWDRKQTAQTLVPHLLEETYEAVEAIQGGEMASLQGELGDLLLNLAFQIVVAEEEGHFHREGVVRQLEEKMIRRHPHLFGLGEKESWESIKARERKRAHPATRAGGEGDGDLTEAEMEGPAGSQVPAPGLEPEPSSEGSLDENASPAPGGVLAGLPRRLDPLHRSHRMQEKVAGVGFDWDAPTGALQKLREELDEVEEALAQGQEGRVREEMGDLLFSVVNLARLVGVHPVPALQGANAKFQRRFQALEELARRRGVALPGADLEELDRLWDEIKLLEED